MITKLCDPQDLLSLKDFSPSVLFLDVDDTLITPLSKLFHHPTTRFLIDQLKEEKPEGWELILHQWRIQRKIRLVHPCWPQIVRNLKERHPVYGLTQMSCDSVVQDFSVAQWRYEELKNLGLEFSSRSALKHPKFTFHEGIFFTEHAKSSVLEGIYRAGNSFCLVDDRLSHLHDMQTFCKERDIPFRGFHFNGVHFLKEPQNPLVAAVQKEYLLRHHRWLEDEEAEAFVELKIK
jgi:hypothetical protein